MAISKQAKSLGMPWEKEYVYSQAVKVGDTILIAGQVSHDETGTIVGVGDMEAQMRQAYTNMVTVLAQHRATIKNLVEEVIFVTDMEAAMAVLGKVRQELFADTVPSATTIVQIQRLAFPELMIEIRGTAKV